MSQESSKLALIFLIIFYSSFFGIIDEEKAIFYQDLLIHPMDLNFTKIEYLQEILDLSTSNLILFENFRKTNYFTSIYELTNFGLTVSEINEKSPYIKVSAITNREINFFYRVATKEKNTNLQFLQSELTIKNLQIYYGVKSYSNITDEELSKLITNSRYNLKYENDILKAVFGHYQLSFGQNLLFGTTTISTIDKIDKPPVYKKTRGIVPYKSFSEDFNNDKNSDYLNGFALNFKIYDTLFPYISISEQALKNNNTNFNITSSLVYKDNFESGILWNYIYNTNLNQASLFYDFSMGKISPFGEVSYSEGISTVHGLLSEFEKLKISALLYYAESNFNSINGQEIIDYKKDIKGGFIGLRYNFSNFFIQPYMNLYFHSTNEKLNQRYEIKTGLDINKNIFSTLSIELKTRYSDITRTRNLRSFVYLDTGILKNRIILELRYQNLLEFERMEMGNMFLARLRLYPFDFLKLKMRYVYYKAKSYYSALFYTEEDFYTGDFAINSYYGIGNEYCIFSELKITPLLDFKMGYSYDRRRVENQNIKDEHKLSICLEGEL